MPRHPTKTVLIAEDDEALAGMVARVLTEAGFAAHCVFNGVCAINEILERKPDVIVLDLNLPRLSGEEICGMVRKSATVNRTPIVVLSGKDDRRTRLRLFELGADDFVAKPFDSEELVARVQVAWQRARTPQASAAAMRG